MNVCTSEWLCHAIEMDLDVYLLDCRTQESFKNAHIRDAIHIFASNILLRRAAKKGSLLIPSLLGGNEKLDKCLTDYKSKTLIVYDDESEDVNDSSPSSTLFKTLKKNDIKVYLLKGGFTQFKERYPALCQSDYEDIRDESILGLNNLHLNDDSIIRVDDFNVKQSKSNGIIFPIEVAPFLFLGNAKTSADEECLLQNNIKYIINVTHNVPNTFESDPQFKYLQIPICDHWNQNLAAFFPKAISFIDEGRKNQKGVLVHCLAGISRSVTITVAYFMHTDGLSLNDAYDYVRKFNKSIYPNFNFMGQLLDYEGKLCSNEKKCDEHENCSKTNNNDCMSTNSSSVKCTCPSSPKYHFISPTNETCSFIPMTTS